MKLKKATMYRQQKFISYPGLLELQNTLYSEWVQAYGNLTVDFFFQISNQYHQTLKLVVYVLKYVLQSFL